MAKIAMPSDVAEYARREGLEIRLIRQMDLAAGCFQAIQGGSGGNCPLCNRLRLTERRPDPPLPFLRS